MNEIIKKLTAQTAFDKKLIAIYVLNVSDYIFTLLLLNSGLFMEANPLLSVPINGLSGFLLKCIAPLALLLILRVRLRSITMKQVKPVWYILDGIIIFYAVVNIFHVFWLFMLVAIINPMLGV